MPSFFDDPYKMQYLGQVGMGLMQAAQPAPYGVNRMSYVANAVNAANQNLRENQLFAMQKKELEEKKAEEAARKASIERLSTGLMSDAYFRGQGPGGMNDAGISWDAPRQPSLMSEGEKLGLMAQISPEEFIRSQLAPPEKPKVTSLMANLDALYSRDDPRWRQGLMEGMKKAPVIGTLNTGDMTVGPMTPTQAGKRTSDALAAKESAASSMAEVESTLDKLAQNPDAVGVRGTVVEQVGGLLQQIPGLADASGKWLNTEEVQATRTQLKSLVGKFVKPITGDTSGKYSDRDMQLVKLATRADDPLASYQQVVTALEAIKEITQRDYARANMKLASVPDLTSRIGVEEYAGRLRSEHPEWDDEKIIEFILSERRKYGVPMEREY